MRAGAIIETTELTRAEVEDFLYAEAEILTDRRWDDWLALFVEGGSYEVPTFDARHLDGSVAQFFIADDWALLQARITRMKSKNAHAEHPPSLTHRLIGNVCHHIEPDDSVRVTANFIVHRSRDRLLDPFVGRYEHELVIVDGQLRFRRRRAVLLTEMVRPGTRLGFIL